MKMGKVNVGDIFQTNAGGKVQVLEYNGWYEVKIQHIGEYGGHVAVVNAGSLLGGRVKNPYLPVLYGVGYIGVGEYARSENQKDTKAYAVWRDMLRRCYCKNSLEKHKTYRHCSVDTRWHNFQNFAEWFYQQPNHDSTGFELDKDLIVLGNKIYGPDYCSFVPAQVNSLLTDHGAARGKFGQGVAKHGKGFKAHISLDGKKKTLGTYATVEEARSVYVSAKEEYVKEVAERYKSVLHPCVYKNLMTWRVYGG